MTTCGDQICGTGGYTGPQPGDPGNNSVLSAVPVFGGIEVSWTFPSVNPHAVAHTLLYRGASTNRDAALLLRVVGGSAYYDRVDSSTTYYYWIRIVSANTGQPGDWIGPASATAKPLIEDMIEQLTGEIDAGVLAQSLKTDIDRITQNAADIQQTVLDRISGDNVLAAAMAEIDQGLVDAVSLITTERTQRQDGQSALATEIDTIAAANASNLALIQSEHTAWVTATDALASTLTTVAATTNNNAAAILTNQTAQAAVNSAMAEDITEIRAATEDNAAAIVVANTAITNNYNTLAGQITTVQSTLGSNIASVQTTLQTNINTVNGKVTSIGALYTAKVSVEGLIGGFGVYNDGSEVEAGFDVDKFWIGRTSANKRKPFIVSDGVVYIDEAAINKLTFSKLRNEDGSFVVVDGKLDGNKVNALPVWLNSAISIAANGQLIGGGGGAVTITGLGFTGSLNADKTSENVAAGIYGQGVLATQNTVSTGQVTGLGALATSDNVFIGSTVRMPGGAVLNTGDFVNALSKINSSNISTFMESAAIADAYIGNLHGSKIIANTITASQMAAGSITAANGAIADLTVSTLKIADEAVTIPRSAVGTYSATVGVSVPYAANYHIIATFTQGTSRNGELIYLAVDGAILTAEAPQDGTTGAMGRVAYLTPGYHTVSVYAANYVGTMACSLLVLGCNK